MSDKLTISETGDGAEVLPKEARARVARGGSEPLPAVQVGDVLDSLEIEVAVVNESGQVIVANEAWKRFTRENGGSDFIGHNYLAACEMDGAGKCVDADAAAAGRGLRSVLDGSAASFEMEYPCHSCSEQRWFHMKISRLHGPQRGAVVTHERITERKQAQEALKLFRNLVDQSADTFEVIDPESGRFLDVNHRGCSDLGYSREEYLSLRVFDIDPMITEANWPEVVAKIRTAGFLSQSDLYHRRKDGSAFPIEVTSKWVRLDREYIVSVVRDITERKQVQDALELFRSLIDQSIDTIEVVDPESARFLDVNEKGCAELGYTRAEFLSMTIFDVDPMNTPANWPVQLARLREHGYIKRQDLTRRRKDGSTFPIEIHAKLVQLDREYLVTVVRDITERKRAEEQVREQAAMLDLAHDAIIVRNFHDHQITFWSRGAEKLYGWTVAEATGQDVGTLICVDPDSSDAIRNALLKANEWRGENRHKTREGGHLIVNTRATLVRDAEGHPKSVLAINTDITEQKGLETRYLRAQRMESIGVLASGVAHDLGNVLLPIEICAPLLRNDLRPDRRDEIISTIEMSAARGVEIVKQILTFGRGVEGERRPLHMDVLIKDLVKILNGIFPKNLQIESMVEPRLPPVMGDSTQLHQVLLNLCVNARDAMPDGGRLRLRASELQVDCDYASMLLDALPGHYTMIEVSDTGTGIAPEILEHMFEPFFTTKGFGQGTGLGLSTVLGIVRSHGGFVNVKTEPRAGTTFQICLPASRETDTTPVDPAFMPPPRGQDELILVVDDEMAVRSAARLGLENGGYRVLLASDGAEAVGLFATNRADIALVLTDLSMPHLDGSGLIRALRRLAPKIPIIVSTGVGERLPRAELKAMDVETILHKPFGSDILLRAIGDALHPDPAV